MNAPFIFIEDGIRCPSSDNCYCFAESLSGGCTLDSEREAGANACDFVQWIKAPASTFDAVEVVAKAFGIDAGTLEEVTQ